MYSPEAMPYTPTGLMEMAREDNLVLDLSIRTQEPECHRERMYSEALHSPESIIIHSPKANHMDDTTGCALSPTILPLTANATTRNRKPTRPFKAYPKNFLGLGTTEGAIDDSDMRFLEFRRQCLSQIHATAGGTGGNKNMKRTVQSMRPASPAQLPSSSIKDQTDLRDQAYWERRRKNNEAAKKSRDARRAKEDELAIRAAFLERENLQLRLELASLKGEMERMRCVLYGKQ